MIYTISDLSKEFRVSKQTIHNKLFKVFKEEFKPFISYVKGVNYVNQEGYELLKFKLGFKGIESEFKEFKYPDIDKQENIVSKGFIIYENPEYIRISEELKELKDKFQMVEIELAEKRISVEHFEKEVKEKESDLNYFKGLVQAEKKEKQELKMLLESAAAKEERKGFFTRLFSSK